jgi:serine/threonine protein phosphatase PrpC
MFQSFFSSVIFGEKKQSRAGSEPITTKTTERGSVNECGVESYAFSGMQGWRVTMEDAHMVCKSIPVEGREPLSKGHSIYGVMDGHGGDFTSGFAADHFIRILSQTLSLKKYSSLSPEDQCDVLGIELLRPALSEAFAALDVEVRKKQNKRNDTVLMMSEQMERKVQSTPTPKMRFERSGSTCVVVLVTPSHVICANSGDSRAVLRRGGKVLPLSFDHKPNNIPELERINKADGFVKSKRVDGDLAVSRGLGDFSYKSNESMPVEKQKVIPDPEFVVYPRDPQKDEFVILACDGVWDVATNDQCADFVQEIFDEGESDLGMLCEEALDTCLEWNSRDNMTLGVVTFEGAKVAKGLNVRNAVWKRRTSRQAKSFETSAKMVAARAAANVGLAFGGLTSEEASKRTVSVTAGFK